MSVATFERLESAVRSYCRHYPAVFSTAENACLTDVSGESYVDLLAGAGTLNYGHNNPTIIKAVVRYLQSSGVVHSLDMHTEAKARFLEVFERNIFAPRGLTYRVQFPGPTGTNAVEAAIKLARKVTGRSDIVAFTNGYHGMTLGALAATTNPEKRSAAGVPLSHVSFLPYDGFLGDGIDDALVATRMSEVRGSGFDPPAAFLLETVQGEGGLRACSPHWLQAIAKLAKRVGALLIVDDIQAGCGRTGTFFSFEGFGVEPDIVLLSKSLSGFGTPLAVVLIRPELDVWTPGEHNGTFRGNNLGFVGATVALETYWSDNQFAATIAQKAKLVRGRLEAISKLLPSGSVVVRGRGLMSGLAFSYAPHATQVSERLYRERILAETCGPDGEVLKLLPPLTIEEATLTSSLDVLKRVTIEVVAARNVLPYEYDGRWSELETH